MSRWAAAAVQPCGTEAAYRRHLRRGEQPCPADLEAAALKAAERRELRARPGYREERLDVLFRDLLDVIAGVCGVAPVVRREPLRHVSDMDLHGVVEVLAEGMGVQPVGVPAGPARVIRFPSASPRRMQRGAA